jgi:hypothetical protein
MLTASENLLPTVSSLMKLNATVTTRLPAENALLTAKRYKVFREIQTSRHKNKIK